MAGRGRGRGTGLSLTPDQLQLLGITRQDNTYSTPTAPPPLFPKLLIKPLPLNCDAATDYMLIVKDQFIEYLHDSPAYVKVKTRTDGVERYSDKYKVLAQDAKKGKILDCNWTHMPTELKPQAGRIRVARKRKLEDPADMDKRLQNLEKKETLEEDNMETNEDEGAAKKGDNDEEDLEDEHEQEDEVDDGTDYANNYFDNGEDYDDEDDNLDDVPVF